MKANHARHPLHIQSPRREFLRQAAFASALFTVPGLFAEQLALTPKQTEGPFYPDKLPLDTDNDLVTINDGLTPAVGEITWLSGRLLTASGSPIRNATIEIWQCDSTGVYLHTRTGGDKAKRDANFQCFGRFITGSTGEYLFRTIKPVPYKPRAPHIHLAVRIKGKKELITQCYIKGHEMNEKDGVYKGIKDNNKNFWYAVKVIKLKGMNTANIYLLNNEVTIMRELEHPNIVKFIDVYYTQNHCYLITEYC